MEEVKEEGMEEGGRGFYYPNKKIWFRERQKVYLDNYRGRESIGIGKWLGETMEDNINIRITLNGKN